VDDRRRVHEPPIDLPVERAEGLPQDQAATMALLLNDLDRERRDETASADRASGRHRAISITSEDDRG